MPLAGRSTWSTLSTFTKDHLVVDCHCGGQLGATLKYSGHDGLIIEGKADTPVYILIEDDKVSIEDASALWGKGTRETTEALCKKHGLECCVATIGPAGENMLPYACVMNSRSHSAGAGLGAVLGSKKCKAVVVKGTKAVNVADPQMPRSSAPTTTTSYPPPSSPGPSTTTRAPVGPPARASTGRLPRAAPSRPASPSPSSPTPWATAA